MAQVRRRIRRRRPHPAGRSARYPLQLSAARRGAACTRPHEPSDRRHAGPEGRACKRPEAFRIRLPASLAWRRGGRPRHPARPCSLDRALGGLRRQGLRQEDRRADHRVELYGSAGPRPVRGAAIRHPQALGRAAPRRRRGHFGATGPAAARKRVRAPRRRPGNRGHLGDGGRIPVRLHRKLGQQAGR